jgi:hypothetical protein
MDIDSYRTNIEENIPGFFTCNENEVESKIDCAMRNGSLKNVTTTHLILLNKCYHALKHKSLNVLDLELLQRGAVPKESLWPKYFHFAETTPYGDAWFEMLTKTYSTTELNASRFTRFPICGVMYEINYLVAWIAFKAKIVRYDRILNYALEHYIDFYMRKVRRGHRDRYYVFNPELLQYGPDEKMTALMTQLQVLSTTIQIEIHKVLKFYDVCHNLETVIAKYTVSYDFGL